MARGFFILRAPTFGDACSCHVEPVTGRRRSGVFCLSPPDVSFSPRDGMINPSFFFLGWSGLVPMQSGQAGLCKSVRAQRPLARCKTPCQMDRRQCLDPPLPSAAEASARCAHRSTIQPKACACASRAFGFFGVRFHWRNRRQLFGEASGVNCALAPSAEPAQQKKKRAIPRLEDRPLERLPLRTFRKSAD